MTSSIKVLDELLINKIAAGEVIERPASVVKELVENSIDAGAKNITIEIKNGGIDLIKITDDGIGIPKDEVTTAFLRHSTSKITQFEDLSSILTLGFRGEALSSIAAISQVEIVTKSLKDKIGCKVNIDGGKLISQNEFASTSGTIFTVKNIFFNTPARKQFLKKPSVESSYISDIINRFALGNPHISFKYINNENLMFQTSGNSDLRTTIFSVYNKDFVNKMVDVFYSKDGFSLSGVIALPELSRNNRSYGSLFINGRYVKNKLIQDAIEEAYEGKLMIGKFPVFVLNLITPANTLDVNVHPTKMEVKFSDESFIFNFVKQSILKTLNSQILIPEYFGDEPSNNLPKLTNVEPYKVESQNNLEEIFLAEQAKIQNKEQNIPNNVLLVKEEANETLTQPLNQTLDVVSKFYESSNHNNKKALSLDSNSYNVTNYTNNEKSSNDGIKNTEIEYKNNEVKAIKNIFNSYKIIGQIFNTYWIVEKDDSIFMIDQHALHEKYLYEKFKNKFNTQNIISQPLVEPYVINVNTVEIETIKTNSNLLKQFGFNFEEFGNNSYIIREVPVIFNNPINPEFFIEIIDTLMDKKISNIYELKIEKLESISCKAAIKGNQKISFREAEEMINQVLDLENPFNCPHGRPTVIKFTKYEIEKMFKRIQN